MMPLRLTFIAVGFAGALLAAGGCTHIAYTRTTPSNPSNPSTPSGGPTATPGPCNTTQATGAVIIPMADAFESTATPPPYGAVNGYGPPNFMPLGPSQLIPTPAPIRIRANDEIQFENIEAFFNNFFTSHSAAFVSSTAFTPNYPFTGEQKQVGTSIGGNTVWSTGPIPATNGANNTCYSQVFRITGQSGTVYFGDIAFYNTANFRNVFIISSAARAKPASHSKQ